VLGQIDPGYEEERLVIKEHLRYPSIVSNWRPAPPAYWEDWHQELRYTDHIIVNSQWSHDALVRQGVPPSKLHTIPLVYTSCQQPSGFLTSNYRLSRSFQLLFIGTICLRKGIARLLEAMDILSNYDIFLTLVGPSEIDSLSWSHLSNVRWIGSVPRSTVASLYRSAHAMILPTISDGFALTQLESLAYGCPVIASTHCGAVIRDGINGWILPSIEPVEIAETILRARATIDSLCYPLSAPSSDLVSLSNALANLP